MSRQLIFFVIVAGISVILFFWGIWRMRYADIATSENLDEEILLGRRLRYGKNSTPCLISDTDREARRNQIRKNSFSTVVISYLMVIVGALPFCF
jgi:hypothetical protein